MAADMSAAASIHAKLHIQTTLQDTDSKFMIPFVDRAICRKAQRTKATGLSSRRCPIHSICYHLKRSIYFVSVSSPCNNSLLLSLTGSLGPRTLIIHSSLDLTLTGLLCLGFVDLI
jgi:hypothetical protein